MSTVEQWEPCEQCTSRLLCCLTSCEKRQVEQFGLASSEPPQIGGAAAMSGRRTQPPFRSAAAPQPAAQPEPSVCVRCGGLVYDPLLVQQPEPGGLPDAAEAECAALSAWNHSEYAINALDTVHPMFLTAFKLGFAATRKLPDEQVARIMAAVKLAISNKVSVHEVERLLRGEA